MVNGGYAHFVRLDGELGNYITIQRFGVSSQWQTTVQFYQLQLFGEGRTFRIFNY